MFKYHSSNIKPMDSYIRMLVGTIVIFFAIVNTSMALVILGLVIYATAFSKFCLIYHLFKINERFSIKNYYSSLLPKHRTTPVFIFNNSGKIVFKNSVAKDKLAHVQSVLDIEVENYQEIIKEDKIETNILEFEDKFYQIELQGLKEEKLLLTYFNDVTEVMELNDAIEETQREVIYAMGEIGETRSKETGNHVKRVAHYSKELALLYGLSHEEASLLQMASPMHDIGKVGIPDSILNAPRKLTADEWVTMQTHAQLGFDMLKSSNKKILQAAATVAHQHHEKWDGSGYPRSLSGEEIHIYGRITAVADVFDALGSERVYKKAWELEDILELFKNESGKHFEPKLIELFIDNLDIFLEIRDKYVDVESEKI